MGPKDFRKSIKALKKICRQNGIDLIVDPQKGAGSHRGIHFIDQKTRERVSLILKGGDDISPGVQRNCLEYLAKTASILVLASRLAKIWKDFFSD